MQKDKIIQKIIMFTSLKKRHFLHPFRTTYRVSGPDPFGFPDSGYGFGFINLDLDPITASGSESGSK